MRVAPKGPVPEKPKQPRGHPKKTAISTLNSLTVGVAAPVPEKPKQPRGRLEKSSLINTAGRPLYWQSVKQTGVALVMMEAEIRYHHIPDLIEKEIMQILHLLCSNGD